MWPEGRVNPWNRLSKILPILFLAFSFATTACSQEPDEKEPAAETFSVVIENKSPSKAPSPSTTTRVVILGSGTPSPLSDRSGPCVAVVVNDRAYLVDFGPGVVRRAQAAATLRGVYALRPILLTTAFATHLHSDHTAGYADLMLTPWSVGRTVPLTVYGPPGIKSMTDHLLAAYEQDRKIRIDGLQELRKESGEPIVHEIDLKEGSRVIYEDRNVKVTAFAVPHGDWEYALGYRFDSADRSIVISGDTAPSEMLIEIAKGCDVLVHEVYSARALETLLPGSRAYHGSYHTSGVELGKIAARVRPKLLVLYHQLAWSTPEQIIEEIRRNYDGEVVYGNDLDVF